jgi:hypothetical protein
MIQYPCSKSIALVIDIYSGIIKPTQELKQCEEYIEGLHQYRSILPETKEYENTKKATLIIMKEEMAQKSLEEIEK